MRFDCPTEIVPRWVPDGSRWFPDLGNTGSNGGAVYADLSHLQRRPHMESSRNMLSVSAVLQPEPCSCG